MKAVLMSIKPKLCELIASGRKTIEVRKTKPKLEVPFKVYIYCTKDNTFAEKTLRGFDDSGRAIYYKAHKGKVIGEFVCDRIGKTFWTKSPANPLWVDGYDEESCLTNRELYEYSKGGTFYEWHITDLVIYDEPRELWEVKSKCKEYGSDNPKCTECHYYIDGMCYEYDESDCGCNGLKPITRPPQGYCYVEEDKDGKP